jgi:TolB-like protein/tRNA A-37 threonylcarbamoyl transferase component Bud32
MQKIFEDALETPDSGRRRLVHERCKGDPSLEIDVNRLLEANETTGFLETPAMDLLGSLGGKNEMYSFASGDLIANRFEILRFLNRGGMGEVYEAWDLELKERVALKAIRPEIALYTDVLERFKREVKQARGISHPNVCRVHELFCHEPNPKVKVWFLSMEFLEGVTLSDHLRHHGPMQTASAFELVEQMVHGLIAAHTLGVIHRDFKTSNVMLVNTGPRRLRAVITDFGLALNVFGPRDGLQEPGGQGTPDFMAPEQKETGEVTFLADQYALGVVICEILTGSRPDRNKDENASTKSLVELPAGALQPRWKRVVVRCLQPRPEDRFTKMEEILTALAPRKMSAQAWAWTAAAVLPLVAIAGIWYTSELGAPATSLAVLPLQNRTGDPTLDYLGVGISEALTNDLSRMPGLQVTAESVAGRYRGDTIDPRSTGRNLRVRSVVDGSIAKPNGTLSVPIELIDVKTGRQVWGQTYEGSLFHVADLQHEISTDVAYRLKIKLDVDTQARLKRQYSTNSSTYDSYLKGRFHLAQRSPDALPEAINDFQRALDSDSQYAPAYAGLADCYSLLAYYGLQEPIPLLNKAMAASQHALEIDSTLGEAYTSRALARTFLNFDWRGAEEDYKRSVELNPNYLAAHTWYGLMLLMPEGRRAEAAAQLAYTQVSDPDSLVTIASLATMNYLAGNFDKSIAVIEPRIHTKPSFEPAFQVLAVDYLAKNMNDRVIGLLEADSLSEEIVRQRAVPLGIAYARTGLKAKAVAKLKIVESSVRDGYFLSYEAAGLYTALNDHQRALDMLELAYARRESNLVFLNVDPLIAPLRSEPRFIRLLRLMNMR